MKVLTKLTLSSMKQNKRRTLVTIIAITLCTVLMLTVSSLCTTIRQMGINTIKEQNGTQHLIIKNIDNDTLNILNNLENNDIEHIYPVNKYTKHSENNFGEITLYGIQKEMFNDLKLHSGRYPNNSKELLVSVSEGLVIDKTINLDNEVYTIVGYYETQYSSVNEIYTLYDENIKEDISLYVYFKDIENLRSKTFNLVDQLDKDFYEDVEFNTNLLALYGDSQNNSTNMLILILLLVVILSSTAIGIFTLIVVYNSYAVSVMERKKMYGELSSIGATKKQIILSMVMEGLIELIISTILGIIITYGLLSLGLIIINNILETNYQFVFYLKYFLISLGMLTLFVLLSSLMPAVEASFITPIEALKENTDIKYKKIKCSKLIRKLFGIEGELAYKNIKRNKRKYSVTTFSLIISFVLFVSVSVFINSLFHKIDFTTNTDFDYVINYNDENIDDFLKAIESNNIKDINVIQEYQVSTKYFNNSIYNESYLNLIKEEKTRIENYYKENNMEQADGINIVTFYKNYYDNYINKLNISSIPILVNKALLDIYLNGESVKYKGEIFKNNPFNIEVCNYIEDFQNKKTSFTNCRSLNNIYITNKAALGLPLNQTNLIVDNKTYEEFQIYRKDHYSQTKYNIVLKVKNTKKLESTLFDLKDNYSFKGINHKLDYLYNIMLYLIAVSVIYFFMIFISLLAIINIYNSISTTIKLRSKEFAVLRSIGMSEKSFNKMIRYETIFFSLKSIIWGLIISGAFILWTNSFFEDIYSNESYFIPLPITYILIASIVLILSTFIIMTLTSKKTKKDNIADILKQDV